MADRKAPGALQVEKTPDYEAMVIGAHPDDDDFGAAGTSALWAKQGKKVVWVVMTDGAEGKRSPQPDRYRLDAGTRARNSVWPAKRWECRR